MISGALARVPSLHLVSAHPLRKVHLEGRAGATEGGKVNREGRKRKEEGGEEKGKTFQNIVRFALFAVWKE